MNIDSESLCSQTLKRDNGSEYLLHACPADFLERVSQHVFIEGGSH